MGAEQFDRRITDPLLLRGGLLFRSKSISFYIGTHLIYRRTREDSQVVDIVIFVSVVISNLRLSAILQAALIVR